jgi:ABC-type bacteriocin/lantibiotic exporter with double-glycine peptidase domain
MKKYLFKQEKPYYCGPASLRYIQRVMGVSKPFSQDQWAVLAGTTAEKGTSAAAMRRCLEGICGGVKTVKGFPYMTPPGSLTYSYFPFAHLQAGIVYDSKRDHWMVASGAASNEIYLFDPETGKSSRVDVETFKSKYLKKHSDFYALVTDLHEGDL